MGDYLNKEIAGMLLREALNSEANKEGGYEKITVGKALDLLSAKYNGANRGELRTALDSIAHNDGTISLLDLKDLRKAETRSPASDTIFEQTVGLAATSLPIPKTQVVAQNQPK